MGEIYYLALIKLHQLKKRVTIHDIAKELNTTAATVSRALNNNPSIGIAMKQRVQEMAKKLNYRQDKIATSLRSGKTQVIGVIIPSAKISFFGSVVHGIESVARKRGYRILLFQTNEKYTSEKEGINTLLQSNVDAIIVSISKETTNYDHFLEVKEQNIPLILFDRTNDTLGFPSVVIDDFKGAYLATTHLIKQGYSNIAHICGQQHIKIFEDRLLGYKSALKDAGLPVKDENIVMGDVSIQSGEEAAEKLLQLTNKPDAIFAAEDFMALGALQTLKKHKLHQPGQFGLVGFANESFGQYITPTLTTVDQRNIEMGEATAELFFSLPSKDLYKEGQVAPKITLEPELILRESSSRKSDK